MANVTLPGIGEKDNQRTEAAVRQLAQQAATYAPLDSPTFTGTPTAPTPAANDNSTNIATTAYVDGGLASKAPLASPALTGTPTAPTAAAGTNTTQLATTAFVVAAITALVNGSPGALDTLKELADALGDDPNFATTITNLLALKAPLASPAFTGSPTAPTQASGDNSTKLATTAYADAAGGWKRVRKTADQSTSSATFSNVTDLSFAIAANAVVAFRVFIAATDATVAGAFGLSGPASPTRLRFGPWGGGQKTAYGDFGSSASLATGYYALAGLIQNGATAGTVNIQFLCNGGTLTIERNSFLEYLVLA